MRLMFRLSLVLVVLGLVGCQQQQAPEEGCTSYEFCIDFYVAAWPSEDATDPFNAGTAFEVPTEGPMAGKILPRPIRPPAARFANSPVTEARDSGRCVGSAALRESIDRTLKQMNAAYESCCVRFRRGKLRIVNMAALQVDDSHTMEDWSGTTSGGTFFVDGAREVDGVNGADDVTALGAFQRAVARLNDGRECLKMLVAPYEGADEAGHTASPGSHSIVDQDALFNPANRGFIAVREVGRSLGLSDENPAPTSDTINGMSRIAPAPPPERKPRMTPANCTTLGAGIPDRADRGFTPAR